MSASTNRKRSIKQNNNSSPTDTVKGVIDKKTTCLRNSHGLSVSEINTEFSNVPDDYKSSDYASSFDYVKDVIITNLERAQKRRDMAYKSQLLRDKLIEKIKKREISNKELANDPFLYQMDTESLNSVRSSVKLLEKLIEENLSRADEETKIATFNKIELKNCVI